MSPLPTYPHQKKKKIKSDNINIKYKANEGEMRYNVNETLKMQFILKNRYS